MNVHNPIGAYRPLHGGMGQAVAERTVLRKKPVMRTVTIEGDWTKLSHEDLEVLILRRAEAEGWRQSIPYDHTMDKLHFERYSDEENTVCIVPTTQTQFENWGDVAHRVALGNAMLIEDSLKKHPTYGFLAEFDALKYYVSQAALLLSGRHLQHGDEDQPNRNMEVFTNCSTSPTRFGLFMLLLNGSGVGTCYDDDMCLTDYDNAPHLRVVIDAKHADYDWQSDETVREARHKYRGQNVIWHEVADSREGWAKAIEHWERLAFERIWKDHTLVLDFSKVRPKGAPIMGMQGRPSSGPKPLMDALVKCASIRGAGMPPWMQALYIDHYLAECVLVGGARRSARMATKWWRDPGIFDFIRIKRPIEFDNLSVEEVAALRKDRAAKGLPPLNSFLWSANNSVMVDREFWELVQRAQEIIAGGKGLSSMSGIARHAYKVFRLLVECSYGDGTGEPGIINADQLVQKDDGWEEMAKTCFVGSKKYQIDEDSHLYLNKLAKAALRKPWHMITNPCGEIALSVLGGYCVIADMVPFHADSLEDALACAQVTTRALIRVNQMDSFYGPEVRRTNRIGVGLTGVHEFAWKFFRCTFRELLNPDFEGERRYHQETDANEANEHADPRIRAAAFWMFLAEMSNQIVDEADDYCSQLGISAPHTALTIKPAGTTSKLFGLTEGWHLPAMLEYLRWVQFRSDDPLVAEYRAKGYPTRDLKQYTGTTIVGFPTRPTICDIGIPPEQLVTAAEATPEEQYEWLRLGEAFWINGQTSYDDPSTGHGRGNQISYTLKYDPEVVGLEEFAEMILKHQPTIRACSVMPQIDGVSFEYQPEEPITKGAFEEISQAIIEALSEDIGKEHIDCSTGACPVDMVEGRKSDL